MKKEPMDKKGTEESKETVGAVESAGTEEGKGTEESVGLKEGREKEELDKGKAETAASEQPSSSKWGENRKKIIMASIIAGAILLGVGFGVWAWWTSSRDDKPEPTQAPTPTVEATLPPTVEPTIEPTLSPSPTPEVRDGQVVSNLTGEWVPEKIGIRRPFAVMINNIGYAAERHSGISQASILYEALVEGGMTRCLAIFEDFDSKKIGSVRSARHYYVSFAEEYDAIFVHFGHTKYAVSKMKELGTHNLSGLEGVGSSIFYRDSSAAPHNAFASYDGIMKGMKLKKYRKKHKEDHVSHFLFHTEDTDLEEGREAAKVTLKFSGYSYASPSFVYDKKKKVYDRVVSGGKHTDRENNKSLAFKNLIVQYVREWDIDRNGYQTMELDSAKGKGWYVTNGKAVRITWEKEGKKGRTVYYDENGDEITLNQGKTYVGVFPNDRMKDVQVSAKAK